MLTGLATARYVFELALGVEAEGGDVVSSDLLIARDCAIILSCHNMKPNPNAHNNTLHCGVTVNTRHQSSSAIF